MTRRYCKIHPMAAIDTETGRCPVERVPEPDSDWQFSDAFRLKLIQDSAKSIIERIDRVIPILDGVVESALVSSLHGAKVDAQAIRISADVLREELEKEEDDFYKCQHCGLPGGH